MNCRSWSLGNPVYVKLEEMLYIVVSRVHWLYIWPTMQSGYTALCREKKFKHHHTIAVHFFVNRERNRSQHWFVKSIGGVVAQAMTNKMVDLINSEGTFAVQL